jgi:predicted alpha-1,6-mannanase (GH76 family)
MDDNSIIINLKVIAAIQPNDKINTSDNFLNIESKNLLPQSIKRWWRGDDRNESLSRLDELITEALTRKDHIVIDNIKNTITGLNNLKNTYSKCIQTVARINTIIEKINITLDSDFDTESLESD